MKLITRQWDPFRELNDFQNRLQEIFPSNGLGLGLRGDGGDAWEPAVDIAEDEKEYTITADLPEVKKEEVDVTVDNGVLTITGERKREEEKEGKTFHRIERSYGKYIRSFNLPEDCDEEKLEAKFNDGVLRIELPKSPAKKKPEQRKIAIK